MKLNIIRILIAVFVLPLMYSMPMAMNENFMSSAHAADPSITFKAKVTAGGLIQASIPIDIWSSNKGIVSNFTTDVSGQITANIYEGYNYAYVRLNDVESTEYVNLSIQIIVKNNVIESVKKINGESIELIGDTYQFVLQTPNVVGTLTTGGVVSRGYIGNVFDVSKGQWINFQSVGPNSSGKYGLLLSPGIYDIFVTPENNVSSIVNCIVPATGITTCNSSNPENNLKFYIKNSANTTLTENVYAYVTESKRSYNSYLWKKDTDGLFKASVNDGTYKLVINSSTPNSDGNSRTFSFSVLNGAVSDLIDVISDEKIAKTSDPFNLQLSVPNFVGIIKANGVAQKDSWAVANQSKGTWYQDSLSDKDGKVRFRLPNGESNVYINPNSSDTASVSSTFTVKVVAGSVTSVKDSNGNTVSSSGSNYDLNLGTPNLKGRITKNGVGIGGQIYGVWRTVTNDWATYQARWPNDDGYFGLMLPAGNYDVLVRPNDGELGLKNCQVSASEITNCNFEFPSENFKLDLKDYLGNKITKDVSVLLSPTSITADDMTIHTFPFRYESNLKQNDNGTFVASLLNGGYYMRIDTTDAAGIGVSRSFDLNVETGTVTSIIDKSTNETLTVSSPVTSISFLVPNLKIKVKANGTAVSGSWYWGNNVVNGNNEGLYGLTDKNGIIAKNLQDGTYQFSFNPRNDENPPVVWESLQVTVETGTVTSAKLSNGETLLAPSGYFEVSLPTTNTSGYIKVDGDSNYVEEISVSNFFDLDKNNWANAKTSSRRGVYYSKVDLGHYAIFTNIYGKGVVASDCNITSISTNTCNVDIPATNFVFKIQNPTGDDLLTDVGSSVNLDIKGYGGIGMWLQMQKSGQFNAVLKKFTNMDYFIQVYGTNGSKNGTSKSYKLTMSGETVTAVTDVVTGASIVKGADGVWPLKLGQPNIAGTVVADDASSTPVPNTAVVTTGPQWNYQISDKSGYFAITTSLDGTYTVWALAPENDMTKADSARTQVIVTNGVGNSNLQLKLRTPNVKGVVSGPLGNSKYNYIQITKKDENGIFQYLTDKYSSSRTTDAQGNFAFYLEPGVYRFIAQADEKYAGGASTVSGDCEIIDVNAVVTCSFNLQSANLKIQLKSLNNTNYREAWSYFGWAGSKNASDQTPAQTWIYGNPNESGVLKFALSNGEWRGKIEVYGTGQESSMELIAVVDNGAITSLKDSDGNTYTSDPTSGIYSIKLLGSNLTGSITVGGKIIDYGAQVNVLKAVDDYYENVSYKWASNGKYSVKVKPGTYIIEVFPYLNSSINGGSPVRTKYKNCVVPESGIATCDVALTTGNLLGEVITPSGESVDYAGVYTYRVLKNAAGNEYESWDQWINQVNGKFTTYLEDGTYRLWVSPNWKTSGKYTFRNYEIVVETSTVQSVKDLTTNTLISKTGDKYQFKLGAPSLIGKVMMPSPSNSTISNVMVTPFNASTGEALWQYQVWTNDAGEFSMSLPSGSYDLVARTWSSGYTYTNSAKYRVAVDTSGAASTADIHMRSPNLTGRVVSPISSSTGLSQVSVNGWFGDQFVYAYTDDDGYFGAYIDTSTVSCPTNCTINLHPNKFGKFVSKSHSISAVGNVGNLALGEVNTYVSVLTPTTNGSGLPNKWAWVMVTEMQVGNSTVIGKTGASANELGVAGLDLTTGHHYQITAYPSWEFYAQYSPKTIDIPSYDATLNSAISITFESPNITLVVQDKDRNPNSWGWFEISKLNGATYDYFSDGYLNELGRAAIYLGEGNYKIHLYPGKGAGVEADALFNVAANGNMSSSDANVTISSNSVAIFKLSSGNISGKVYAPGGSKVLGNIAVTAIKTSDSSTVVSTVTRKDGSFELNLNVTFDWIIKAIDPDTLATGTVNISATSPSNKSITGQDITLVAP